MISLHLIGSSSTTNSIHPTSRVSVLIILLFFCFSVQGADKDTVVKPAGTQKSVPAGKTLSAPTTDGFGEKIIQSVKKVDLRDIFLTELSEVIRSIFPPSLASFFIYLIKLSYQSDVLFVLLLLVFYFLFLNIFIGIYLVIAKLRTNYKERIQTRLEEKYHDLIASFLFQESEDQSIPALLTRQKSLFRKNILIGLMVRLNSDLEGDIAQRLHYLYRELELDQVSLWKIRSGKWNVIIQGFRELANMDVEEAIESIRGYIHNPKDELRSEALIALVRLDKKNPFWFLDELQAPFTKWEQLNVFSIAKKYVQDIPPFNKWLYHKNITVVRFALAMIGIYQQLDAIDDIIKLLRHRDNEIRKLSIRLLGEFRLIDHESLLRNRYSQESEENKLEIILALIKIPDMTQIDFFIKILIRSSSQPILLAASRALSDIGPEGKAAFNTLRVKLAQKLDPVYYHIIDKRI